MIFIQIDQHRVSLNFVDMELVGIAGSLDRMGLAEDTLRIGQPEVEREQV